MAKSRRRMARPPGRRRAPADWVYRGDLYDGAGAPLDVSGTYVPDLSKGLIPGYLNGTVFWLYDSYNFTSDVETVGLGMAPKGRFRRAEGSNPKILRVRGSMSVTPSTWAVGSSYFLGIRFGRFRQDANNGLAIFDANYNMWGPTNPTTQQMLMPARFANDRSWVLERYHIERFNDNNFSLNWRFNFPVNRTLKPDEGFGMYVETGFGSVNIQFNLRLSALVSDANS